MKTREQRVADLETEHEDCYCHATKYTCNIGILLEEIEELKIRL